MISLSLRVAMLLVITTAPLHCVGRNIHGKYLKRSTENQGSLKSPDDVSFKQEDINPESTINTGDSQKPFDDVTLKKDDANSESTADLFKAFDDATIKQDDTNPELAVGQESTSLVSFNLPPWLMYFKQLWDEILTNENELRVKFPSEFEVDNDVAEIGSQNDLDTGWAEGVFEAVNDDAADIDVSPPEWTQDDAIDTAEGPEIPDVFEAPENNFEPFETDSTLPEFTESLQEPEVDNTEPEAFSTDSTFEPSAEQNTPETKTELDGFWNQGHLGFTGNWMQGMVNTAMGVLQGQDNTLPNDDIPDRLKHTAFNTHSINPPREPGEDLDSGSSTAPETVDLLQSFDNGMNNGMVFTNPFHPALPTFFNTETAINSQPEQDSSS